MLHLPATRTDTDNPGDTVAGTDDADKAADCTVAVDETVAGVAGIVAPDVDADADTDDDAGAGDTIHDYNHPYHNESHVPTESVSSVRGEKGKLAQMANISITCQIGSGRSIVVFRILFRAEYPTSPSPSLPLRRVSLYCLPASFVPIDGWLDGKNYCEIPIAPEFSKTYLARLFHPSYSLFLFFFFFPLLLHYSIHRTIW